MLSLLEALEAAQRVLLRQKALEAQLSKVAPASEVAPEATQGGYMPMACKEGWRLLNPPPPGWCPLGMTLPAARFVR